MSKKETVRKIEENSLDIFEGFFKDVEPEGFKELVKDAEPEERGKDSRDFFGGFEPFNIDSFDAPSSFGTPNGALDVKGDESVALSSTEESKLQGAVKKAFTEFDAIVGATPMSLQQENFLRAYVKCKNLTKARTVAGVTRSQYNGWVSKETGFAECVKNVNDLVADMLEDTALQMALDGNEKLLIKMLEAYRPEKFSPKKAIDVSTRSDVNINVNSWSELARKAMLAGKKAVDAELVEESSEEGDDDDVLRLP